MKIATRRTFAAQYSIAPGAARRFGDPTPSARRMALLKPPAAEAAAAVSEGGSMFGLDDRIAAVGDGQAFLIVAAIAVLLGLRHATDPDHLTAVTTLLGGERDLGPRRAGFLGLSWGLGHATTLVALGLPIVLFDDYLPQPVQQAAELAIGFVIMALAVRLLMRWRRGHLHAHPHMHRGRAHAHPHVHERRHANGDPGRHAHGHAPALG